MRARSFDGGFKPVRLPFSRRERVVKITGRLLGHNRREQSQTANRRFGRSADAAAAPSGAPEPREFPHGGRERWPKAADSAPQPISHADRFSSPLTG
jgi:hypothetical protein